MPPVSEYDKWSGGHGVSEDLVVGKVVGRVPWVGLATLFLRRNPYGLPVVIAVILLLILVEFVLPVVRKKLVQQKTIEQAT